MSTRAQLARLEKILSNARGGNADALDLLRAYVAECSRVAPPADLIEIGDFIVDFLRRHVRDYVSRN
jgi:hypothetical protein